jgi:hypothetical protein
MTHSERAWWLGTYILVVLRLLGVEVLGHGAARGHGLHRIHLDGYIGVKETRKKMLEVLFEIVEESSQVVAKSVP